MSGKTRAERAKGWGMPIAATKDEALRHVADWAAGLLLAGDLEEAVGIPEHVLTEAEARRYWWAIEEVSRRLYAMGRRGSGTEGKQAEKGQQS